MKCELVALGSLCKRVVSGGTPKSTISDYYNGSIPWLNTKEVHFNRIYETEKTISELGLHNSSAKWISSCCIIIAMYGATAGNVAINLVPLTTNQACCNLEIDETKADYRYIYYYLSKNYTMLSSLANGGAQQNLNTKLIKDFSIVVPSLQVQSNIADILWSIDDKIEINNKINENLEQQARALLTQWLIENYGTYEFPLLSEVAVINPDTYSPKDAWEFVNYLDTSSITDGVISEVQHIKPSTEKLPSRARRIVAANDVVFSTVRPKQRHFGIITDPLDNMLASTGFAVVRSNHPSVSNELLYLCLTEDSFIEKMQQLAEQSTSTFPSIKPSDLEGCKIPCPVSMNLTKTLEALFACISNNRKENITLAKLRDDLLPKLMSGEIDVSNSNV